VKKLFYCTFFALLATACNILPDCIEKSNPDCLCTEQYAPVCGCNNKTYSNSCFAECAGIVDYTNGPCNNAGISLEGREWKLTAFTDGEIIQAVPDSIVMTIEFSGGALKGFSACNDFQGSYVLTGNGLTITHLLSNAAFCPAVDSWETKFQTFFREIQSFDISDSTLQIHCVGFGSLVFKPT